MHWDLPPFSRHSNINKNIFLVCIADGLGITVACVNLTWARKQLQQDVHWECLHLTAALLKLSSVLFWKLSLWPDISFLRWGRLSNNGLTFVSLLCASGPSSANSVAGLAGAWQMCGPRGALDPNNGTGWADRRLLPSLSSSHYHQCVALSHRSPWNSHLRLSDHPSSGSAYYHPPSAICLPPNDLCVAFKLQYFHFFCVWAVKEFPGLGYSMNDFYMLYLYIAYLYYSESRLCLDIWLVRYIMLEIIWLDFFTVCRRSYCVYNFPLFTMDVLAYPSLQPPPSLPDVLGTSQLAVPVYLGDAPLLSSLFCLPPLRPSHTPPFALPVHLALMGGYL